MHDKATGETFFRHDTSGAVRWERPSIADEVPAIGRKPQIHPSQSVAASGPEEVSAPDSDPGLPDELEQHEDKSSYESYDPSA